MEISSWQALLLGILQGATEFLPVSSSGHLVLIPSLLHWPAPPLTYDVIVHLGTLVAVVIAFWGDIGELLLGAWGILKKRRLVDAQARLVALLLASAIPGALLGYFLEDRFAALFGSPFRVSLLLAVTGLLLVVSERLGRRERTLPQMGWGDALLMGLAQGCAIAPGLSRSGTTIAAGLFRGLERQAATRFSFLMSLPIILGATGYQLLHLLRGEAGAVSLLSLAIGFVAAAASGYLAVRFLLQYVRRHSLRPFAYYCWALSLLGLIWGLMA